MAIFNSFLYVYQAGYVMRPWWTSKGVTESLGHHHSVHRTRSIRASRPKPVIARVAQGDTESECDFLDPMKSIVISTINPSEIGVVPMNTRSLFAYNKPYWHWRYVHQLSEFVDGGPTLWLSLALHCCWIRSWGPNKNWSIPCRIPRFGKYQNHRQTENPRL